MFDQLVSSKVKREVAPVRGMVVGMLHGIAIAGMIRVTERAPEPPIDKPVPIQIPYDEPRRPAPVSVTSDPGTTVMHSEAPVLPPAPVDMPPSLLPISSGPAIDPSVLRRMLSSETPGRTPGGRDSVSLPGVLAAAQVDEPAVVLHQPSPRYPTVLQQAGLEGRVLVEFVIDTAGHMEGASLRVLESSNPGFDAAAGETVAHSVFRPARVHGRAVRQRTVQSIVFRIAPE